MKCKQCKGRSHIPNAETIAAMKEADDMLGKKDPSIFYDMDGNKISFHEFMRLDRCVANDLISEICTVSTYLLGIDQDRNSKPPKIFLTSVFPINYKDPYKIDNWEKLSATKEEAIKEHDKMVENIMKHIRAMEKLNGKVS